MVTTSPNKGYSVPTVGGDAGAWGNELNTSLGLLDQNLGGTMAVNVTGSSATTIGGITLTSTQMANLGFAFTGVLGQNYTITIPGGSPSPGMRWFYNGTTQASGGPFNIKVVCSASPGNTITIPVSGSDSISQTYATNITCDGTNVYFLGGTAAAVSSGSSSGGSGSVASVPAGGTGQTTLAAGSVLVGNGINPVTLVPPGASGTILTSNGASAAPSFQSVTSNLLNTVSMAGSGAVVDTTSLGLGFSSYLVICSGVFGTASAINLQYSQNGGASYITTGYTNAYYNIQGSTFTVGALNVGGIPLSGTANAPASGSPFSILFYIYAPALTSAAKITSFWCGGNTASGNAITVSGHGWLGGATQLNPVTAFRVISGGTFSAGTMRVYGVP